MAHVVDENVTVFVGNIIHCIEAFSAHTLEKGFLAVRGSKVTLTLDLDKIQAPSPPNLLLQIIAVDYAYLLEETLDKFGFTDVTEVILDDSQILIPGLIDTHIHAPQYPNAGLGYDETLLDWLQKYTFPLESKYSDTEFAEKVYDAVVRKTLHCGTTTACYFGTLYNESNLQLVDAAIRYGQRAFVGKVNMTQASTFGYCETSEETVSNTKKFIEDVLDRKSDIVKPIITPRFALSLDMHDMKNLAALAEEYDLHIQTHISENQDEVRLVKEKYGMSYAEVYRTAGLITDKTVLAHGIYLEDKEIDLLAALGTSVAHCPESNTNLKSGLCDVKKLARNKVTLGLGSDVSGGAFPSIVNAMRYAVQTSIHISFNFEDYDPLNCYDAFYLATLGGANALNLGHKIGNFEVGKEFDALIVDMDVPNSSADYLHSCSPIEVLQKFVFLGDDRNIISVYVAGRKVK